MCRSHGMFDAWVGHRFEYAAYIGFRYFMKKLVGLVLLCSVSCHAAEEVGDVARVLSELNRQSESAELVKSMNEPWAASVVVAKESSKAAPSSKATPKESLLQQLSAAASSTVNRFKQTGLASWYGRQFHGQKTASGERFDMNALTAAHPSLPLNCYVKVTNKGNGKSVVVRINDRGPFHGNRVLDLSYGAAKAIGLTQSGTGNVAIERVEAP